MEDVKNTLSQNLIALRKSKKLTQSELAEMINYSDKTISKWENGDATPDVETLCALAKIYNVSLDSLVNGTKEDVAKESAVLEPQVKKRKAIISLLAVSVVWIIATMTFFYLHLFMDIYYWMAFIWALPTSCIVGLVFNSIWGNRAINFVIITLLVWTILLSLYLQLIEHRMWLIFVLGAPIQVAIILWSQLKSGKKKDRNKKGKNKNEN